MSLASYQQLVNALVRDTSGVLMPTDRDLAIRLALQRYSADAERKLVEDVTWTAAGHTGPMPESWAAGSYLLGAEYPIGETPPAEIDVAVYAYTDGTRELQAADALSAGAVVRVTFTAPHVLAASPDAVDTIPEEHMEALASYAASVLCRQLAAHYSGERETSINADASNTASRAQAYAARAKDYRAAYYHGIGKADPAQAGSGGGQAGSGEQPAASVGSWAGRTRANLRSNDIGGGW